VTEFKNLVIEETDGVVKLTLNRPDKLNALNMETYVELGKVLDRLENNSNFKALVVTGAGRAFCAGGDIRELVKVTESIDAAQKRLTFSHSLMGRMKNLRQPIIAAINGDTIGGGLSLALNCDLRIASENSRFGATFIKIGLVPDMGLIYNLARLIGTSKACELALLGGIINATEARQIGLINAVVAPDELSGAVETWSKKLASFSPLALRLTKEAIYKAENIDFQAELKSECHIQSICLNSDNGREGLKAFLEKRTPVFK